MGIGNGFVGPMGQVCKNDELDNIKWESPDQSWNLLSFQSNLESIIIPIKLGTYYHSRPEDLDLLGTPGGVHFRKAHQKVWICYRGKKICYRGKKTLESLDLLSG